MEKESKFIPEQENGTEQWKEIKNPEDLKSIESGSIIKLSNKNLPKRYPDDPKTAEEWDKMEDWEKKGMFHPNDYSEEGNLYVVSSNSWEHDQSDPRHIKNPDGYIYSQELTLKKLIDPDETPRIVSFRGSGYKYTLDNFSLELADNIDIKSFEGKSISGNEELSVEEGINQFKADAHERINEGKKEIAEARAAEKEARKKKDKAAREAKKQELRESMERYENARKPYDEAVDKGHLIRDELLGKKEFTELSVQSKSDLKLEKKPQKKGRVPQLRDYEMHSGKNRLSMKDKQGNYYEINEGFWENQNISDKSDITFKILNGEMIICAPITPPDESSRTYAIATLDGRLLACHDYIDPQTLEVHSEQNAISYTERIVGYSRAGGRIEETRQITIKVETSNQEPPEEKKGFFQRVFTRSNPRNLE